MLVAINAKGEIWIDKKLVDDKSVRANIERLHAENPKGGLVVQSDRLATVDKLLAVLDAARQAGVTDVSVSTVDRLASTKTTPPAAARLDTHLR